MALNKLKKWIGTQAMTAFFDQLNDNVDATNAAIDVAEAHTAESATQDVHGLAGKIIAESGSNTKGYYIKFDDGTMICYGRIAKYLDITTAFGALFRNENDTLTIEYPVPFYNHSPALSVLSSGGLTAFFANQAATDALGAKLYALRPTSSSGAFQADWQAIGRWK